MEGEDKTSNTCVVEKSNYSENGTKKNEATLYCANTFRHTGLK